MPALTSISNCRCGNPPIHDVPEHLAIAASKALGHFVISVNALFVGQPVSWQTKYLPDPTLFPIVRLWNAQTNKALPGSQHEKNLVLNATRMPNTKLLVQLGDKVDMPDFEYIAILQNLVKLQATHPNIYAVGVWNEANSANGANLSSDAVGHKAGLCRQYVGGKLVIVGPTFQGKTAITSLLAHWATTYGKLVDVLDHHIYYWATGPSVYNDTLNQLVKPCVAIANSIGKPMWHTEGGLTGFAKNSVAPPVATQFLTDYLRAIRDGGSACYLHWALDTTDQPLVSFLDPQTRATLTSLGQAFVTLAEQNLLL